MSFNTALVSGDYDKLRGTSSLRPSFAGDVNLSLCPNTTVYSARVNQASFAASFAQVTYDGGSGTLANVRADMTILLSRTNSAAAAYHTGRIRKTPTSTIFYVNETSADVQDNDYIFVIDDFRIWDKLHRVSGGAILLDYEITFRQLLPIVYNLKSAYAESIATGASIITLTLAPLAIAATSGATISTWAWSVGDGTITVGSSSTQNITVTFPAGFRWIHLTVTDSGSRSITRHIPVWAHDDTYPVQLLTHDELEVSATLDSGFNGTVAAFDGIDTLLDNTLVCAWGADTYNGAVASITGDNVHLVGRIRQSTDQAQADAVYTLLSDARLTIESPLAQIARLQELTFEVRFDATPTVWGDIKDLTLWRAVHFLLSEFSTFENLHSVNFSNTDSTYRFFGSKTQGGNILAAANDLAESINASLLMNSSGMCEVNRDAVLIDSADREALPIVANWTVEDIFDLQYEHDHVLTVGRVQASGGTYSTSANKITELLSLAPGVAQDYPEGQSNLTRQIVAANVSKNTAQAELNRRTGFTLAKAQTVDRLTITHPDGYHWLTPSNNQWYTFTLDGSETVKGLVLTTATRWLLTEVTTTHDGARGTKEVRATYSRETTGQAGQTINVPPPSQTPLTIPLLPMPPLPALGISPIWLPEIPVDEQLPLYDDPAGIVPTDGNAVVYCTVNHVARATNAIKAAKPNWEDVTPSGLADPILQVRLDPFGKGAYLLTGGNEWCYEFDFTASNGSWTTRSVFSGTPGSYSGGTGWTHGDFRSSAASSFYRGVEIERTFSSATITSIEMEFNLTKGSYTATSDYGVVRIHSPVGTTRAQILRTAAVSGSGQTLTFTGLITQTSITLFLHSSVQASASYSGSATITKVTIRGTGVNPFGADNCSSSGISTLWECPDIWANPVEWAQGGTIGSGYNRIRATSTADALYAYSPVAETKYSTDRGATWASARAVGASPGSFGGLAPISIGAAVLAGADNQVMIATSAGGTYSAYGSAMPALSDPNALLIPRYQFGSSSVSNASTSTPQYLVASSTLTAGNAALWKVTASGATFTDITPTTGGQYGKAVSQQCLATPWFNASRIVTLLQYGSNVKLGVSVNSGSSWAFSANLNASASWLTLRKGDEQMRQAFIANGTDGVGYCANYRATTPVINNKPILTDDAVICVDVYG